MKKKVKLVVKRKHAVKSVKRKATKVSRSLKKAARPVQKRKSIVRPDWRSIVSEKLSKISGDAGLRMYVTGAARLPFGVSRNEPREVLEHRAKEERYVKPGWNPHNITL